MPRPYNPQPQIGRGQRSVSKGRTMLEKWFDVEVYDMVFDTEGDPILARLSP